MINTVIIGYGKLGSHLRAALNTSKKAKVISVVKDARSKISTAAIRRADVIFITTQDSKIRNAVKKLLSNGAALDGKYVFHTSGSLTSAELDKLAERGTFTGSFHPVQTFETKVTKDAGRFKKIYIAVEGSPAAEKKAGQIISILGAKKLLLTKEDKVYHHICCVIASNFVTTLISSIEDIGKIMSAGKKSGARGVKGKRVLKNGFNNQSFFNIYKPLASQTIENIASKGAAGALTGPFERNDLNTILKHLETLNNKTLNNEMLPVYILMGIETVKLSLEKKSIRHNDAAKILKAFDKSLKINKIH